MYNLNNFNLNFLKIKLICFSPGIGVIDPRMISVMSVRASVVFY